MAATADMGILRAVAAQCSKNGLTYVSYRKAQLSNSLRKPNSKPTVRLAQAIRCETRMQKSDKKESEVWGLWQRVWRGLGHVQFELDGLGLIDCWAIQQCPFGCRPYANRLWLDSTTCKKHRKVPRKAVWEYHQGDFCHGLHVALNFWDDLPKLLWRHHLFGLCKWGVRSHLSTEIYSEVNTVFWSMVGRSRCLIPEGGW